MARRRRRLTWPAGAPRVGIHLGVANGLMPAARRARQIGAAALQIFSDNPTAWRRRPEPPADAPRFVEFCISEGIAPVAIHASYLINLAGSAEPFASQSVAGLRHEMQRALVMGAGRGEILEEDLSPSLRGRAAAAGGPAAPGEGATFVIELPLPSPVGAHPG